MSIEQQFASAWETNWRRLANYIHTHDQEEYADTYESLVRVLFDLVVNPYITSSFKETKYDASNVHVFGWGDDGGIMVFILHKNTMLVDVSECVYTSIRYGGYSGLGALESIKKNNPKGLPTKQQGMEYMTLFSRLLRNCHGMR